MIPSSQEMEEELRFHIESRAADLEKRGRTPQQALREARLEFGSVPRYLEEGRVARGWRWRDLAAGSFAAASRFFHRSPAFACVSILTLTLGIGVATLIASLAHGILLAPLRYPDADRLYNVRIASPPFASIHADLPVSANHVEAWRQQCTLCEAITLIDGAVYSLAGHSARVNALEVTPDFFHIVGADAQAGRTLQPHEYGPAAPRLALLSDQLWRSRFQADPRIIGATIHLDNEPTKIAGVLPPTLPLPHGEQLGEMMHFPPSIDLILPSRVDAEAEDPTHFRWSALVKLRPGASVAAAQSQMDAILAPLARSAELEMHPKLVPLHSQITSDAHLPLRLLLAAAALFLLVVSANFGNLQLARIADRRKDVAIHSALGATRAGLLIHGLSEPLLLVSIGACAAWLSAIAALRLLTRLGPAFLPRLPEVSLNPGAWVLAASLPVVTAVLCVLIPLRAFSRIEPGHSLHLVSLPGERRLRQSLLFTAASASVALAGVAAILLLSYTRLRTTDHGFATAQLSTLHITTPARVTDPAARRQQHATLLNKLRSLPGVHAAASANRLPLQGETWVNPIQRPAARYTDGPLGTWRFVSNGYFAAAGTALRAGRDFSIADQGQRVAIVSERVANEIFPGEDPLGRLIEQEERGSVLHARIVGVVADAKARHIESRAPLMVYLPDWQAQGPDAFYLIRSFSDTAELLARIQQEVAANGMELPVERIASMQRMVDNATASRRWQTIWTAAFALAAVLTACLGLAGVVAFQVSRRVTEIGIRMALGATRFHTARLLLRDSLLPIWPGLLVGTAFAMSAALVLQPSLYSVGLRDAWVPLATAALVALAATSTAATAVFRAINIEPAHALRAE